MMRDRKKKSVFVLVLLLIFVIPILITLFVLEENLDDNLKKGSIRSVTLLYNEKEHELDKKEEIDLFVSIAESGEKIEEAALPLSEYRKCQVVFHKLNHDVSYAFYLSDSVHNCVYKNAQGTLFLLPEENAKKLLAHPVLSGFAVSYASFPTMTFTQGGEVFGAKSVSGEWSYAKANDTNSQEKIDEKTDEIVILPQGEKLNFNFSISPDFCSVTLQNEKGEILFSGDPEKMEPIAMEKDTTLSLVAKCDWYEDNHEEYHGSLTYTFDIFYDIPTTCSVDRNSVYPGEMITLTVLNSSSDDIVVTPTFSAGQIQKVKDDNAWTILVPVSEDATAGDFSMMVMGLDVEETFPVTINPIS